MGYLDHLKADSRNVTKNSKTLATKPDNHFIVFLNKIQTTTDYKGCDFFPLFVTSQTLRHFLMVDLAIWLPPLLFPAQSPLHEKLYPNRACTLFNQATSALVQGLKSSLEVRRPGCRPLLLAP